MAVRSARPVWWALGLLVIATAVQVREASRSLPAWRASLVDVGAADAALTREEHRPPRTTHLLRHRFPFHGTGWRFVPDEQTPVGATPPPTPGVRDQEGDQAFWRFDQSRAAMALALPAEAGRLLEVELQVRVNGEAPQDPDVPRRGVLALLPLRQVVDLDDRLTQDSLIELWGAEATLGRPRLALVPETPVRGWQTLRGAFRVPLDARCLLLVFATGDGSDRVDLARLEIRELPLRELCFPEDSGAPPRLDLPPTASPVADLGIRWRDEPRALARVTCLDETRDAVVLPPRGRWSTAVTLPEGPLRLEFGVARLHESRELWNQRALDLEVRVTQGAREHLLLTTELDPASPTGWRDQDVDLDRFAGDTVELRFTVQGNFSEDLVAIGSPVLRRRAGRRPAPNVVLVSLDTVRADHLGVAGHPRPTTPHLDELARRNHWFRNAFSTSSYTLPSHASMMTGQWPSLHGAISAAPGRSRMLPARSELLALRLQEAGYHTAGFTGGGYLFPEFGFDLGFDRYSCVDPLLSDQDPWWTERPVPHQRAFNLAHRQHQRMDQVQEWVRRHRDAPFFLFLHTFVVHNYLPDEAHHQAFHAGPYEDSHAFLEWKTDKTRDPTTMPPELLQAGLDAYDAGLRQADEAVGQLVTFLQELRLWQDTLLIVTSDHGEEFLDHGRLGHGRTLYEEQLHVPLIVHFPGNEPPRVVDDPVSLVDLLPTVLDVLDLPPAVLVHGRSLREPVGPDQDEQRLVFAELDLTPDNRWQAAVTATWKYLEQQPDPAGSHPGLRSLFQRAADPGETLDRSGERPDLLRRLADRTRDVLERAAQARAALGDRGDLESMSAETLRALWALGYTVDG